MSLITARYYFCSRRLKHPVHWPRKTVKPINRKEDLANGSIISSCEVAKQLSAHRNRNGVFALAPDNYNDYSAYQCYQCPRHGPCPSPTEDDNGIIHQIAPVVIPRAPAVSSSVQQCPAVFVLLLIIMSTVPASCCPLSLAAGHPDIR